MTVMATTLDQGSPLEEVFFRVEQADRLGKWLEHHEMPENRVVQAFLTARTAGVDVVCRTCPQCCKYLVELDPTAVVQPKKAHSCGHCLHVLHESLPTVCNPIAGF